MSFNTNTPKPSGNPPDENRVEAAICFLRQGFVAEAYLLLSQPGNEKNPAALFALGLCHLHAGEYDAAITHFEKSLHLIKALPSPPPSPRENSETAIRLAKKQINERIYLTPMDEDFCRRFPKSAGPMALLALIHVYLQKGMTEQAQRLAAGLIGSAFDEYKKTLAESQ